MKKIRDEAIISALLTSATAKDAAKKLSISVQTIYHRRQDPEFCRLLDAAQREQLESASNALRERSRAAADVLDEIMRDKGTPAQTRANAAAEVLRQSLRYTETVDIVRKITELEEWRRNTDAKR